MEITIMLSAANSRMHPNSVESHNPPYIFDSMVPSRTPSTIKGSHFIKSFLSMFPLLRCEKHEDSDVGIIVNMELVVAMMIASAGSM